MTIKQARDLLGEEVEGLADEEIRRDIETAIFFTNIMFDKIKNMSSGGRGKLLKKT